MIPAGVQARGAGRPATRCPTFNRMESVRVFIGSHRFQHAPRIDLLRQRHLHQNAVDLGAPVQSRR